MLESLIAPVSNLLERFIPDADTKQKIAHELVPKFLATRNRMGLRPRSWCQLLSIPDSRRFWRRDTASRWQYTNAYFNGTLRDWRHEII